ncbi:MAG: phosphatidate cytidylyltransferase [Desulfobulbaceae bacterium]|nr:phosphatidate cytidylyltransferase [Desulfobulbaceae bacterium]
MTRLLPGLVMTALWVLLLVFGPADLFWLVVTLIAVFGLYEYYKMTIAIPVGARLVQTILFTLSPVLVAYFQRPELFMPALFVSLIGIILLSLKYHKRFGHILLFLGFSSFGALYIGLCLAHMVLIRYLPEGAAWLLVLTAVTAGGDTGAYYIGTTFGRRKLCPEISPGKTVEGAIGGIVAGSMAAVAMGFLLLPEYNSIVIFASALVLSVVSIIGDLAESVIKRSAGVKDSGTLLFGHGGVLDRVDGMLITAPVLYYLLALGIL